MKPKYKSFVITVIVNFKTKERKHVTVYVYIFVITTLSNKVAVTLESKEKSF